MLMYIEFFKMKKMAINDINFDDIFDNIFKEQIAEDDYLQDVRNGKIQFDNTNPLAIKNIMNAAKSGNLEVLQELKTMKEKQGGKVPNFNAVLLNQKMER